MLSSVARGGHTVNGVVSHPTVKEVFDMYVQIVEFELQGVTQGDYEAMSEQLAPVFSEMPGLISKLWIVEPESSRAGGVYTWVDRAACEAYKTGDVYRAAIENPALANLRSREFDVLEAPTRITADRLVATSA
jgi:Putative mono-oxygenase ydhR